MKLLENEKYKEDIKYVADLVLPWEKLKDHSILISGATGLIGSCLIDIILYKNQHHNLNCMIYAVGRNEQRAKERFKYYYDTKWFNFITHDINEPLEEYNIDKVDYVLHLASNTHPVAYATDPIGTITTNIIGTRNMLDFATKHQTKRFAFASSSKVYGENRGDIEKFTEDYCGYINCNTLSAGYAESKRCGEALCQAYIIQKNLDIVILRLTHAYGPTMLMNDTKASSQFIKNSLNNEDIILKSEGTQYFSYIYVIDAISALLMILLYGKCGEAYNIADEDSDIRLRDLATFIAKVSKTNVVYKLPSSIENKGYIKVTKSRLDSTKLQSLKWKAKYNIKQGIKRTIEILKEN